MLSRAGRRLTALACSAALLGCSAAACAVGGDRVTLRVLASPELADLRPVLDDLRRDTGVRLELDHQGTVHAGTALRTGEYRHDLAWLSSDRFLRLELDASGNRVEKPPGTSVMTSPVVVGLKRATVDRLRRAAGTDRLSWADLAADAAAGNLRFGMADPRMSDSGLVALIGVATAAAGTGTALRPQDVGCDRLRGFFTGQAFTASTAAGLAGRFTALQDRTDGLIGYESELMALNASGRLREPLTIVYPRDGMVMADYPLLLLDPAERTAYDKVVDWLTGRSAQRAIMERTLRRPVDPEVPRDPRLREPIGNALYFPGSKEVIDRLLKNYDEREPGHVLFVLDYSGSMRGARTAALRSAFDGLGGADDSAAGKFVRFHRGERITVIRFGGRILGERTFTVGDQGGMTSLRAFIETADFDGGTAVWSALDHAYRTAEGLLREDPEQPVSIVLMTDGESNAGLGLPEFLRIRAEHGVPVRTYTIRYGEAASGELDRAARALGGWTADGTEQSLLNAFKEIRGCR